MASIWLKANLRHTADIEGLYNRLPTDKITLGGEHQEYTIIFTGSDEDGIPIVNEILREGHCRIQITCGF